MVKFLVLPRPLLLSLVLFAVTPTTVRGNDENFYRQVISSTTNVWANLFFAQGLSYHPPRLHFIAEAAVTPCGSIHRSSGPFYCSVDKTVYLNAEQIRRIAPEFDSHFQMSRAYIIAHEVGHHVQNLLSITTATHVLKQIQPGWIRGLSIRVELQADCFAGVWAFHAQRNLSLPATEMFSGLRSAGELGDDHLQLKLAGQVFPHLFTHGTSQQRMSWLSKGMLSGLVSSCDTFSIPIQLME